VLAVLRAASCAVCSAARCTRLSAFKLWQCCPAQALMNVCFCACCVCAVSRAGLRALIYSGDHDLCVSSGSGEQSVVTWV
jgi:hypothetical protein